MAQLRPQLPYMNFYRFCQLLEKNHPKAPIIGSGWLLGDEPIRFRPHPGMGFPAGEIRGMDDPEPPRPPAVRVTFMGLYGVESPSITVSGANIPTRQPFGRAARTTSRSICWAWRGWAYRDVPPLPQRRCRDFWRCCR